MLFMVQISVVIITYNEEKNIERCILSLLPVADEILVVDSYSTDGTEEICKKHNVRFIQHPFAGHIEQKQWALEQASNDYILSLDADEVLSETLQKSITGVKNNWAYDSYEFNRLNYYCGKWIKHSDWYPDRKIRLLDRRTGRWGGKNPHDKITIDPDASCKYIKGDLLHYTYHSIKEHIHQTAYFAEIAARDAFERGRNTSFAEIILRSAWKFKRNYFFKLGFLDGYFGFVICTITAFGTFVKYTRLRELNGQKIP
jgi:glycosyltransferase involved in cell wall biosynthesis